MRSGLILVALTILLAISCDETETVPQTTTTPDPVCGNAIMETGEACDPYAPAAEWSCPDRACAADCTCTDAMGTGGSAGAGGEGGMGGSAGGGVGAGLPVGGDGSYDCDAAAGTPGTLTLTAIATGFDRPVLAIAPDGEADRLYVIEQRGRILLYEGGSATVFLDIEPLVSCCGERGLLGLAFHPDYQTNGRFFVHYSEITSGGDTVVAEYQRDPSDADRALPDPVATLLTVDQPAGNHNGGALLISPVDGHLYVALGDGGGGGDQFNNGQNLATRLGGILRIDISQSPAVAAGNYPGGDAYLAMIGLRNPWRASFDACTGDLYIGDVGQSALEEIDIAPAGVLHQNFGWNVMEGTACYDPPTGCDQNGLTLPIAEYSHADNDCSVTGGYVYRGSNIPWLRGTYFYGDYCTGRSWSLSWDGSTAQNLVERSDELGTLGKRISSWGQDASGELYVFDLSEGTLFRIDAR